MIQSIRKITDDGEIVSTDDKHFTDSMNEDGYRIPSHKAGCRFFADVPLPKCLSHQDKGRLYDLSFYLIGDVNLLGYRTGKNIVGYTPQEICKIADIKGARAREFLKRMSDLHIIKKFDLGYYMNPAYFMVSGKRLSLDMFLHFQDELIPILPRWALNSFLQQAKEKNKACIDSAE